MQKKHYNDWTSFKTAMLAKERDNFLQYEELLNAANPSEDRYVLWFPDGRLICQHILYKTVTVDKEDFEDNYQSSANQALEPVIKGTKATLVKPKPVSGTLYQNWIYFTTQDDQSLDDGGDTDWNIILPNNTTTRIEFNPNYNYDLEGGYLKVMVDPFSDEFKVTFIMAPGISDIEFVKNKKINSINTEYSLIAPPKYIKYYSGIPTANKMRLEITHAADIQIDVEFALQIYK